MIIRVNVLILFFFLCSFACEQKKENIPNINNIEIELNINHLEDIFVDFDQLEKVDSFLEHNKDLVQNYFTKNPAMQQGQDTTFLSNVLLGFGQDLYVDTLYQEIKQNFGDFKDLEKGLTLLFKHIKYYYPDYQLPKIYTIISAFGSFGFGNDIFITDSLLIIGLDYFSTNMTRYKPSGIPDYLARRYTKEHLLTSVALALSTLLNEYNINDHTLLAEIIFYGKSYAFVEKVLPEITDSLIIGYTQKEIDIAHKNEKEIWAHIVESNLLYSQTNEAKKKYVYERPFTSEIADNCPGRIGRWIGWQITKNYLKNTNKTFIEMMSFQDATVLLKESKYRPKDFKE